MWRYYYERRHKPQNRNEDGDSTPRSDTSSPISFPDNPVPIACNCTNYHKLVLFLFFLWVYLSFILFYMVSMSSPFTYLTVLTWMLVLFFILFLTIHARTMEENQPQSREGRRRRRRCENSQHYNIDTVVVVPPIAAALAPTSVSSAQFQQSLARGQLLLLEEPDSCSMSMSLTTASVYGNNEIEDNPPYIMHPLEDRPITSPILDGIRTYNDPSSPAPPYDPPPPYYDCIGK